MKTNKLLASKIKQVSGNVLAIGDFSEEILKQIDENTNITKCDILSNNFQSEGKGKKGKKIYLSKLRKKFKKKKTNYLICNYDELNNYLKIFVKDSIYITKDYIYFCTKEKDKIIKKYSRYNTEIEEIKCTDGYILIINTKKAKNKRFKEFIYNIIDITVDAIDSITELLLN